MRFEKARRLASLAEGAPAGHAIPRNYLAGLGVTICKLFVRTIPLTYSYLTQTFHNHHCLTFVGCYKVRRKQREWKRCSELHI